IFGNIGQCDYAYANGFMDGFASQREFLRKQGRRYGKTISINWPLWQDGGMRLDAASSELLENTLGIVPLITTDGIRALEHVFSNEDAQQIVLSGYRQKIIQKLATATKLVNENSAKIFNNAAIETDKVDNEALLHKVQNKIIAI